MKKKLLLFMLCMLFVLGGCTSSSGEEREVFSSIFEGLPKEERLVLTATLPMNVTGFRLPAAEYTNISCRTVSWDGRNKIYSFTGEGDTDKGYHAFSYFVGAPLGYAEFEWYGNIAVGEKFGSIVNGIVLSDDAQQYRMYFQQLEYSETMKAEIIGRTEKEWEKLADHSLKSTKEFYEVVEEQEFLKVIYSVGNQEWDGYIAFHYNFAEQTAYEIIYIEQSGIYNSESALEVIQSVECVSPYIEQTVFELTVECGEPIVLYAEDVFDGNILSLSAMSGSTEKELTVGENSLLFSDGKNTYPVKLNIVDTLPPEIIYRECAETIQYFMSGEELDAQRLADGIFEASDRSGAVEIVFADGREQVTISEEEFGGTNLKEVVLQVTDSSGNMCEVVVYPAMLDDGRIPEWYHVFFEDKVDRTSVSKLGRILSDTSCKPEEYLQAWYKAGGIGLSISNENMENALQGYQRMGAMGFEVAVSDTVQPAEEVLFYANLNQVPEALLQKYIESGKAYELDELEAREYQTFHITQELAESAVKGMKKAEEGGISFVCDGSMDISAVLDAYTSIESNGTDEDFITFVATYDDNMTEQEIVALLDVLREDRTALDGYLRLKNLGIDVEISEIASAETITRWFEGAYNFPEELVQIYVDNEWDVIVPEGFLSLYVLDNNHIFLNNTAEKAIEGYEMANGMGVEIVFDEQMTFLELARFYEHLPQLPEEFLQLCAEEEIKLSTSLDDLCLYVGTNIQPLDDVVASYRGMEATGLDIGFEKGVSLQTLVSFFRVMEDMPEEFINIYVKNDWKVALSSAKGRVYEDALNYFNDAIYEEAWNGYNKIQKNKIKVKYLDVWQPTELIMFYVAINKIPEEVWKEFREQGWTLILSDDNLKKKYNTSIEAAGVTYYVVKVIEVVSCNNIMYIKETVLHEMGHYLNFADWEDTRRFFSDDEKEFANLYRRIKKKEKGGEKGNRESDGSLGDVISSNYTSHSFSDKHEFFADSYMLYIDYPDELKEKYPEVYDYMDKCSKSLQ